MKTPLILGLSVLLSITGAFAIDSSERWEHRVEIFANEMSDFVEGALSFRESAVSMTAAQQEAAVEDLMETAGRVSQIYFSSLHLDEKSELDEILRIAIKDYRDIRVFFYLIGNRFIFDAQALLEAQQEKEKRVRLWSTAGGAVLGLASGAALIYFKVPGTEHLIGKATALLVMTSAGGAAGRYGGPALYSYIVPVDPDVLTAKDFLIRYPEGQNFINDLSLHEIDLANGLADLQEDFNDLF